MKKLLFSLFTLACVLTGNAMESNDTTQVTTLNDIINQESKNRIDVSYDQHLRNIFGKTMFFNISYNKTKLSSDEFPIPASKTGGHNEFKNKFGVGIQWGKTFNFTKKALGNVMFVGIDATWMDLNFNQYDKGDKTPDFDVDEGMLIKSMPWHNKKTTLDYGISVGPSITLYPFIPLHSNTTDHIRLNGYFHLGYKGEAYIIKEVAEKTQHAWGHGLFTAFGGSLTFNSIGVGIEVRNDNVNVKHVDKKEYGEQKMKFKEKVTRFYLQFRF